MTMNKDDFIEWEANNGFNLHYTNISLNLEFNEIETNGFRDEIAMCIKRLAQDENVLDIRAEWHEKNIVAIYTGYSYKEDEWTLETVTYIHY